MIVKEHILSDRLKNNGKYPFWLTRVQRSARKRYLQIIGDTDFSYHDNCVICNGDRAVLIAATERRGLPVNTYLCEGCGVLFKNPVLNEEASQKYYEEISYNLRGKTYASNDLEMLFHERVQQFAIKRYELLRSKIHLEKGDLIAEVGCNDGANLVPWHDAGFDVIGFDWDDTLLGFGRKKGLKLLKGNASQLSSLNLKPKLIILSHVLEHLRDPITELKGYRELLEPNGYLFIEVPGIKKWCLDFLAYFDVEHNFSFNLGVLKRITSQCGYSLEYGDEFILMILKTGTIGDKMSSVVNEGDVINMDFLKKIEDDYENNGKYYLKRLRFLLINYFLFFIDDLVPIPNIVLSLLRIR
jgi:2-polyprenyl-3-methyl-5-hydroxy-6-metoxy-1,4-benzoquinol methylase